MPYFGYKGRGAEEKLKAPQSFVNLFEVGLCEQFENFKICLKIWRFFIKLVTKFMLMLEK